MSYPGDEKTVNAFYTESERLVRFLSKEGPEKFVQFVEAVSKGNRIETALSKAYGPLYPSIDALERAFLPYATKDHDSVD